MCDREGKAREGFELAETSARCEAFMQMKPHKQVQGVRGQDSDLVSKQFPDTKYLKNSNLNNFVFSMKKYIVIHFVALLWKLQNFSFSTLRYI